MQALDPTYPAARPTSSCGPGARGLWRRPAHWSQTWCKHCTVRPLPASGPRCLPIGWRSRCLPIGWGPALPSHWLEVALRFHWLEARAAVPSPGRCPTTPPPGRDLAQQPSWWWREGGTRQPPGRGDAGLGVGSRGRFKTATPARKLRRASRIIPANNDAQLAMKKQPAKPKSRKTPKTVGNVLQTLSVNGEISPRALPGTTCKDRPGLCPLRPRR